MLGRTRSLLFRREVMTTQRLPVQTRWVRLDTLEVARILRDYTS